MRKVCYRETIKNTWWQWTCSIAWLQTTQEISGIWKEDKEIFVYIQYFNFTSNNMTNKKWIN